MLILFFQIIRSFDHYYPHYLHSCSIPNVTRLHIFWGRIQGPNIRHLQRNALSDYQNDIVSVQNCSYRKQRDLQQQRKTRGFTRKNPNRKQISISFVIQSNLSKILGFKPVIQQNKYCVEWQDKKYCICMLYNEQEVEYRNYASSSYVMGGHKPYDSWRWGYRLQTLLKKQKQIYKFNNSTADMNMDVTSFSVQFNFDKAFLKNIKFVIRQQNSTFKGYKIQNQKIQQSHHQSCTAAAYQQLLKGQSYSYGYLKIKNYDQGPQIPKDILSFTPSRIRFPWSFLWDDGFHLQVIVRKDPIKALQVIKSWLNSMSQKGWIPRQQSRGMERQFLCNCNKFIYKDKRDGNPPSLILPLFYLYQNHLELLKQHFGLQYYQKLKKWYKWYLITQRPKQNSYLFKWFDSIQVTQRGGGSFNSGLDDYPRKPLKNSSKQAYHIDAQAWMYQFTKLLTYLSSVFEPQKKDKFQTIMDQIRQEAFKIMLDSDHLLKDVLTNNNKTIYSPHIGYINLFPLAFGMLKHNSTQLNAILNLITNTSILNTTYGLSSISKLSPLFYQTSSSYWRGPIWMNINYLVVRGLKKYYPQLHMIAQQLSKQLKSNICKQWKRTGYFFQNYDARNGKGSFSNTFSGWTALVNILQNQNDKIKQ